MRVISRYELDKIFIKIFMGIAWLMPRSIVYWCYIRVHSYATTHKYSDKTPDEVTWSMALEEWGTSK